MRYATPKFLPGTEGCKKRCMCDEEFHTVHDPPLIFDMATNPYEDKPLSVTDPRFSTIVQAAEDAVRHHEESVVVVENQMSDENHKFNPYLMPCCNFPFCSCKDEKRKV